MKSQYLTSCCWDISFQEKIFNSQHFAEVKPSKPSWWQILHKNTLIYIWNGSFHVPFLSSSVDVLIWTPTWFKTCHFWQSLFLKQERGNIRKHKQVMLAPDFLQGCKFRFRFISLETSVSLGGMETKCCWPFRYHIHCRKYKLSKN